MNDLNRITNWLKPDDLDWLKKEKKRLDAEPSGDFTCHIAESKKPGFGKSFALFYDKIYFVNGTMHQL
jgi:hypothetical protein